ncbi:MAG: hypothetical protein NTX82_06315 [Candidatus Parcubacteria bacterium]|nr:hypothetical protein [Candidatus Parcubacteria bacterium]
MKSLEKRIKKNTKQVREMHKKNPHRDWKYNLSPARIKELEKVMKV